MLIQSRSGDRTTHPKEKQSTNSHPNSKTDSDQQHHHSSYRTFALMYLECIVERWSRNILTSTKMGQEQHHDELVSAQSPTSLQGDPPRSLAAVVSSGRRVLETSTTTQISGYNNTATKASERSSNAWHRPPILIPPGLPKIQHHMLSLQIQINQPTAEMDPNIVSRT
jgi:hypothetical protein